MRYKCTAHITYDVIVEAASEEEAEIMVFEGLADHITQGLIPMDLFEAGNKQMPIPFLERVEVAAEEVTI